MSPASRQTERHDIRAIVLDVDGTLLGRDGSVSAANRAAVVSAGERGLAVILATGRIPTETVGYYSDLSLDTPMVCYHGALVVRPGSDEPALVDAPLPESVAREVVAFILAGDPEAQVLLGLASRYVVNRLGGLSEKWDMSGPSRPAEGRLDEALGERVYKVCYFSNHLPRVAELIERAGAAFVGRAAMQQAHAHLAEMLAPGVSKAGGVAAALQTIGCRWSDVLAIGDYHNDAEMLRCAAVGVAMAGAPDAVKAAADFVTADCDDDGVALALDRFLQ